MKLEFESIEEVKEFVTKLKGARGGKADKDDETGPSTGQLAPAPLAPPAAGAGGFPGTGGATFTPPTGGAAFPAAATTGPAPEVLALVQRINTRIEWAMSPAGGGQPADQVLQWFRGECGKAGVGDTTNATLDQIKTVFLPKMAVPALENIAKLMNA